MLHDIHEINSELCIVLVSSGVHIYLGTEYFSFYALYFPHHTHVFFLCDFRCYAWHWALRAIWFTCTWSNRIYQEDRSEGNFQRMNEGG